MSYLVNLRSALGHILGMERKNFAFEVSIGKTGEKTPEFFGTFRATPEFLADFEELCNKHSCGEKDG